MEFITIRRPWNTPQNTILFPVMRLGVRGDYGLITGPYRGLPPVDKAMDLKRFLSLLPQYIKFIQTAQQSYGFTYDDLVFNWLQDLNMVRMYASGTSLHQLKGLGRATKVWTVGHLLVTTDFSDRTKVGYLLLCCFFDEHPRNDREAHIKSMLANEYPSGELLGLLNPKQGPKQEENIDFSLDGTMLREIDRSMLRGDRPSGSTRRYQGLGRASVGLGGVGGIGRMFDDSLSDELIEPPSEPTEVSDETFT